MGVCLAWFFFLFERVLAGTGDVWLLAIVYHN